MFQKRLSVYESSGQGKSNGLSAKLFDDAFQVRAFLQLDINDAARKDWKGMMLRSSKDFRECFCISLATRSFSVAQKKTCCQKQDFTQTESLPSVVRIQLSTSA